MVDKTVRDPSFPEVDWTEIWRTVGSVTPNEWDGIKAELRAGYDRILTLIGEMAAWPSAAEIEGAIAVIAHTAYHLGEIRQALVPASVYLSVKGCRHVPGCLAAWGYPHGTGGTSLPACSAGAGQPHPGPIRRR